MTIESLVLTQITQEGMTNMSEQILRPFLIESYILQKNLVYDDCYNLIVFHIQT